MILRSRYKKSAHTKLQYKSGHSLGLAGVCIERKERLKLKRIGESNQPVSVIRRRKATAKRSKITID